MDQDFSEYPLPSYIRKKAPSFSREDHREALTHAMMESFGLPVTSPHPLATALTKDGHNELTFLDLAASSMELAFGRVPEITGDGFGVIVQALSTPDLPAVIEETARGISRDRKSDLLDSILALSHQAEVRDYRAESYSMVDLDGLQAPDATTMADYTFAHVKVNGEAINAYSLFCRILISRQCLVNDDRNYVKAAINAFLASAHRNEMDMIVIAIETNANLADGSPLFHGDTGNLTVAALDAAGLGTAFSTLRAQPTESGDKSDATPHAMLVHSDDEVAALALVETLPDARRPQVVSTSRLANSDAWYLFANPELYPVIGRVRLEGSNPNAVSFAGFEEAVMRDPETGGNIAFNGVALPATHSVGFNVLSRIGACKFTKS